MVPPGGAGIGMHVIPVEKAIETENRSADIEHISHWLKKYEGKYAASPLLLPHVPRPHGRGLRRRPGGLVHRRGRYGRLSWWRPTKRPLCYLRRGPGHPAAAPRTTALCTRSPTLTARTKSLPSATATSTSATPCAPASCSTRPICRRSAYVAKVKTENCVACGRCVEYCPAGAVKLGQKLCTQERPGGISPAGAARRREVGPGKMGRRLPRQQPHQLLRRRHGPLQNGLPRAHRRAGLPENGRARPLHRRAGAYQKRESLPRRMRPRVQPPL